MSSYENEETLIHSVKSLDKKKQGDNDDKTQLKPRKRHVSDKNLTSNSKNEVLENTRNITSQGNGPGSNETQLDNDATVLFKTSQKASNISKHPPNDDHTRFHVKSEGGKRSKDAADKLGKNLQARRSSDRAPENNSNISIPSNNTPESLGNGAQSNDSFSQGSDTYPSENADVIHNVINQRFVLDVALGAGGMGTVYKAKDLRKVEAKDRNPWVAIKLLNNAFKEHPDAFISLQREARKTQGLAHPNIVRVYDFDRSGDMVYMTMELLEGDALDNVLRKNPNGLGKEAAFQLVRECGGALVEAHSLNIIHSDFKPGNIFYTGENKSKVFDFGIARAVSNIDLEDEQEQKNHSDDTVFDAGSLGALTPTYASYEMLTGQVPSPSDDLYALGCVAYQALTGKHPYNRTPADKALEQKMKPHPVEGLTRRESRALKKAVAIKKEDRYETVDEFLHDFLPEHHRFTRKVKLALTLAVMIVIGGGVKYGEALYEEQQRTQALKIEQQKAEAHLAKMKVLEAQYKSQQALKADLENAFAQQQKKAADIQHDLDQQINLSAFADTYEWQLQTNNKVTELDKVYRNENWLKTFYASHPEEQYQSIFEDIEQSRMDAISKTESWISYFRKKVAKIYIDTGDDLLAIPDVNKAKKMHLLASQYSEESASIEAFEGRINQVSMSLKREKQARLQAVLSEKYTEENIRINEDIASCSVKLAGNGRASSFTYDIYGLKQQTALLSDKYPSMASQRKVDHQQQMQELANCIQLYGFSDPKGATHQLKVAAQNFPEQAAVFNATTIRPFNTCKPSFAEKGRRYNCQDRFIENLHVKGPKLVVIPAKPGINMFAIGKYEISESEFNRYCDNTSECKSTNKKLSSYPVTNRSLEQITGYISWLNKQTGFEYALPSYEQWRYAASARDSGLDKNRNCQLSARGINKGLRLVPVNIGEANKWGLVNHVGNAQEWVLKGGNNVMVGGSRLTAMENCSLDTEEPINIKGSEVNGFRLVRKIKTS